MDARRATGRRRVSDRQPLFRDTRGLGVVGSITLRLEVSSMDRELRNLRVPYFLRLPQATKHTADLIVRRGSGCRPRRISARGRSDRTRVIDRIRQSQSAASRSVSLSAYHRIAGVRDRICRHKSAAAIFEKCLAGCLHLFAVRLKPLDELWNTLFNFGRWTITEKTF